MGAKIALSSAFLPSFALFAPDFSGYSKLLGDLRMFRFSPDEAVLARVLDEGDFCATLEERTLLVGGLFLSEK